MEVEIRSNQVANMLHRCSQYLSQFQPKYNKIIENIQSYFQKTFSKTELSSDIRNIVDRSLKTQQRLFQQLLNVSNRLLDFIKNPKTEQEKKQSVAKYYQKAKQLFQEDKYKQALFYINMNQELIKSLQSTQHFVNHCILKGEIHHSQKQPELSNYYLERPQILQRNDFQILYTIALNYQSLGDGSAKNKRNKGWFKNKARDAKIKINKQFILKSIEYFNKAIELNPIEFSIYDDLCDAYKLMGFIKQYQQTKVRQANVALNTKQQGQCYKDLARYQYQQGLINESLGSYSKSLQIESNQNKLPLILQVIKIMESLKDNDLETIVYLQQAVNIMKTKSKIQQISSNFHFIKLAKYYNRCRKFKQQLEIHLYLLQLYANQSRTQPIERYKEIALCYYNIQDYSTSQRYLLKSLQLNRFKTGTYWLLIQVYEKQEDYLAAKDVLLKLKKLENTSQIIQKQLYLQKIVGTQEEVANLEQSLKIIS